MLTQRLRQLERDGLVERTEARGAFTRVSYRLTPHGSELAPALQALYDWGERRTEREGIVIEPVSESPVVGPP